MTRREIVKTAFGLACVTSLSGMSAILSACTSSNNVANASNSWLSSDPQTRTLFFFDTLITLTAYCDTTLMDKAAERCQYFENAFSRTVENSDIWRINEARGAEVEVASETADIIARAIEYSRETKGLFDISIGSVSSLWDFIAGIKPSDAAIQEAVKHVDYTKISVDDGRSTIRLEDPDMKLDLGGIAKGYIADDLANLFREGGCESAAISLGGNVYVLGLKAGKDKWTIGIRNPNDEGQSIIASCEGADTSVVTSGVYERSFTQNDTLYYHILDPKTGYPAKTDLSAVSIISEKSIDGDVFATATFLMGHDEALHFIEEHEGFDGLVVKEDGAITLASGSTIQLR